MSLISELRRRNVFRMAALYTVAAWLIMQVAEVIITLGALPEWTGQVLLAVLAIGFPIALIFSWIYELTPEGITLETNVEPHKSITHVTGRRMDFIVISFLCAAVLLFAYDKWWTYGPPHQSIAVLPFVNMSDDAGNEFLSEGISEEILNLLAQIPELKVTSRSSAFSFKGQNLDVPTMAAKLNVAHVLEGSVRKSGNELRITAQLIEVGTDTHLWSETYDRELESVFTIQDEIAAAVVDALKITLLGKAPRSTEIDPETYTLYLQGRHLSRQGTAAGHKEAEALLVRALEIEPGYAPAWTELSYVYERQTAQFALLSKDKGYQLARDSIQRALDIDPQYGRAYAILANVEMFYEWNFNAALQHVQQAQALNPGDAAVLFSAARLNTILGRLDTAIDLFQRTIVLDPVWPTAHYRLGRTFYYAHRLDEATGSLQMALSLSPDHGGAKALISLVLLAKEDAPAALDQLTDTTSNHAMAIVQHALGNDRESEVALQKFIEEYGSDGAFQVARIYAFRGEIDNAFDWLDQAYNNRDGGLTAILVDPLLTNLHGDSRWEPFLDKMGLPY